MSGISKGKHIRTFEINKQDHQYFDELASVLITSIPFVITLQLLKTRSSPFVELADEKLDMIEFPFESLKKNEVYSLKFVQILRRILKGDSIEVIQIEVYEKSVDSIETVPKTTLIKHSDSFYFIRKLLSACFVSFYEKAKNIFIHKYSTNSEVWPMELNFARTVRNAFAHDGKITINNPKAKPVKWNEKTYSPENNGQSIYDDFFLVEVIELMNTVNDHIK